MNEFIVTINERKHKVKIFEDGKIAIGDKTVPTEITRLSSNTYLFRYGKKVFEIATNKISGGRFSFLICGWQLEATVRTVLQEAASQMKQKNLNGGHVYEIKAPMPGLILKMKKKIGEAVNSNEAILLLEAMKMENEIRSPRDGIIKKIFYSEGQSVEKGSTIMTIE